MLAPSQIRAELERCHEDGFGWALACCRWDAAEAEETLQATYEKVLDGRARFGGRASFRTWLFAVIRRTAAERRRRRLARRLALGRLAGETVEAPVPAPDEQAAADRLALRLEQALTRLARRQREVLHLVFYAGLSVEEASRAMGVSVGSARTHYARGKRRLRELLGEDAADGG
ncbi:MAG: RNA polymerase sigma factor [Myxococcota bacterium]